MLVREGTSKYDISIEAQLENDAGEIAQKPPTVMPFTKVEII